MPLGKKMKMSIIKKYIRLYKARNRPKPEYIKEALDHAVWLTSNYPPNEMRLYLKTLHGKLDKLKNQRIEELEAELIELRKL